MYLCLILLPLFNSLFIGLFGYLIGRQITIYSSVLTLLINNILVLFIINEILLNDNIIFLNLYTLLIINDIKLNISFIFDQLVSIMLLVIITISTFVHIFTVGYMSHDPFIIRFYTYLGLFTFFMIILVTADNLIQLFIGWEGVGLCSYLLINFWYNRIAANKAAIKAMLMNRIADIFFIFAILLLLLEFKTVDYFIIFSLLDYIENYNLNFFFSQYRLIDLIVFFLFIGAMGKSAQIGLHTWLPDAMEGPTPVSALLHAATMVTAGVFLLIRCSFIFEKSNIILFIIIIIGIYTALLSALIATFQYDIKKIIAYSTCSQLGYMFLSCGLSNYNITLFHLFNHAFFKALLFLGAGSIISSLLDEQDMRKLGYLCYKMSFTYISILIGSLAILGFPFLTGFYSKDILLEFTWVTYSFEGIYIYILGILTALLTAIYSFKLIFYSFLKKTNIFNKYIKVEENNVYIIISLFILSLLSIFIGFIFSDIFVGLGNNYMYKSIYISFEHYNNIEFEFLNPLIKNIPLIVSFIGIIIYIFFYKIIIKNKKLYNFLFLIKKYIYIKFYNAGFFNLIYNKIYIYFLYLCYNINVKIIEKGYFELIGPIGFYLLLRNLSYKSRFLNPFFINIAILLIYLFIIIILYYILLYYYLFINNIIILLLLYYIIEE